MLCDEGNRRIMNREAFPSVARYLDGLPQGLDSHPECSMKGSLTRSLVEDSPLTSLEPGDLPDPVVELIVEPPAVTDWVPEVHGHVILLAIRDRNFDTVEAFHRFSYERQRKLFQGPTYQLMMKQVKPRMLLEGAGARWGTFHRGTDLQIVRGHKSRTAGVVLSYPNRLFGRVAAGSLAQGFRAVLDTAGAKGAICEVAAVGPTETHFKASWT